MPESRRRKSKPAKQAKGGVKVKIKGGRKYLRMRDEHGAWEWRPFPMNDEEKDT